MSGLCQHYTVLYDFLIFDCFMGSAAKLIILDKHDMIEILLFLIFHPF